MVGCASFFVFGLIHAVKVRFEGQGRRGYRSIIGRPPDAKTKWMTWTVLGLHIEDWSLVVKQII